ncbi:MULTISPECIES: pneumococcal-type histidine triad protein [unclassified Streptococcus]|uniref:pneumococcal-type histidine triad protein n=1 Tax=unclassified Streptococcus TaxID=2608887 RepID=UPI00107261B6|nr:MULTISPECIES: pneumococcal-type histidine triad protein [unclassified Streptococcus]MBF0787789.1 pneumococcal-type histidine triad protein [Streptococcus sp. 19428wC2_LYSM12]MCQ9212763.1 pneumococcal-type histidine triad protein [Streptococcus sp. B01]MCQ9214104.1 pneumococcal-type histidine triad protein [Streptococcus sp. O1]TFV05185.1 pneumococcal-type histidine triad protein [Streptococcus sp. LYSM12]
MKKKYIIGSVVALSLSLCSYELGRYKGAEKNESNQVNYVEHTASSKEKAEVKIEELTPEQVSAKENNAAEQIVIKITDQGYVTSHGDHFHYYNGKVPYDAIISEELILKDPDYKLQEADIVNQVNDGYIIKVNGHYYLYLSNKENPTNVRSKEDIDWQRHQYGQAQTNAGQLTEAAALAKEQGRYTTDDGYVFNPSDIIEDMGDAYLVPHGAHFHYIPKSELSPDELRLAQSYWKRRGQMITDYPKPQLPRYIHQAPRPSEPQPAGTTLFTPNRPKQAVKPMIQPALPTEEEVIHLLKELYALPLDKRYVEEDGLVFDPVQITNRVERGVVIPHGNHYHFIPYSKLSALEQKIAKMIPLGRRFPSLTNLKGVGIVRGQQTSKPTKPTNPLQPTRPEPAPTPSKPSSDKPKASITSQATLLAPKKDISATYKDFYQAAYQLIASVAGEQADQVAYDKLNQLVMALNGEPTDKVGLTRSILACISLLQYPERIGKPNSKIAYTAQELQVATLAGMYTTSDGYIFEASNIISDEGDGYLTPHMEHSHYIPKKDLSVTEQEEARRYVVEAGLQDKEEALIPPATSEKAIDIYNRVEPAKLVPVEDMPYRSAYVVDLQNEQIIIPHHNHYHNLSLYLFDTGHFEAPEGYTLEQFLATVKYYVLHPAERPASADGYGISSDYGKISEDYDDEDEDDASYEPDEDELEQQRLAGEYGMPVEEFQKKLVILAGKYNLSIENFSYQPEQKTISLLGKAGRTVVVSLETMTELPVGG